MMINISHIQRFSVGDGPGIRTTVFFKGCNLFCPWCHNPETHSPLPETLVFQQTGKITQCGKLMSAEDIYALVQRDADFYLESGGGVTLSGGEVLLQAEGARELVILLKQHGLHVLLDTAGDVPWSSFEAVMPFIDQYYYDWKAPSANAYADIGGSYERILSNLRQLLERGQNVSVRIPLIESFNTEPEQINSICETLSSIGVKNVDLLPFHRLGSSKYDALSRKYAYADRPSMTIERAEELSKPYARYFAIHIEK